jgi:phytoene dehydrogenase-like protein
MWNDLGVMDGRTYINHDRYSKVVGADGKTVTIYADPDKSQAEFLKAFPEDSKEIKRFFSAVRLAARTALPDPMDRTLSSLLGFILSMPTLIYLIIKWNIKAKDYADRLKTKGFADVIRSLFADDFSMVFMIMTLGWLADENAGYPIGGSLEFSRAIESKYISLGGTVHYQSDVKKITVESFTDTKGLRTDRATGIILADGTEISGDYVISASDGINTISNLLGGKYHNLKLKKAWETLPLFKPLFYISIGLSRSVEPEPSVSGTVVYFSKPVTTDFGEVNKVLFHSMAFDPTLAPAGKSVASIMVETDFDFWKDMDRKSEKYIKIKDNSATLILKALERDQYPGLMNEVEQIDVATPLTWVRYTGVHRGAFEGMQLTPDVFKTGMSLPQTLDGLKNFRICGQWTEPGGGVPVAAASGRKAAMEIIAEFTAS